VLPTVVARSRRVAGRQVEALTRNTQQRYIAQRFSEHMQRDQNPCSRAGYTTTDVDRAGGTLYSWSSCSKLSSSEKEHGAARSRCQTVSLKDDRITFGKEFTGVAGQMPTSRG